MMLVQNCAEENLGCNNLHLICGHNLKVQWWNQMNSLGRGRDETRSPPGSSWSSAWGAHKCDISYKHQVMHKVFRLPQTPPVFLFHMYCSVNAHWTQEKSLISLSPPPPLIHYTVPSHPPYIGWRIFRSPFDTCLLYRLRARCCQV